MEWRLRNGIIPFYRETWLDRIAFALMDVVARRYPLLWTPHFETYCRFRWVAHRGGWRLGRYV